MRAPATIRRSPTAYRVALIESSATITPSTHSSTRVVIRSSSVNLAPMWCHCPGVTASGASTRNHAPEASVIRTRGKFVSSTPTDTIMLFTPAADRA